MFSHSESNERKKQVNLTILMYHFNCTHKCVHHLLHLLCVLKGIYDYNIHSIPNTLYSAIYSFIRYWRPLTREFYMKLIAWLQSKSC